MAVKLFLVRGLPGSGKTTKARKLAVQHSAIHLEADHYFEVILGDAIPVYGFVGSLVGEAHNRCKQLATHWLRAGYPVVVSNTFTIKWEIEPYYEMAKKLGIEYEVVTCTGDYGSVHNVPEAALQKMKDRWEDDVE